MTWYRMKQAFHIMAQNSEAVAAVCENRFKRATSETMIKTAPAARSINEDERLLYLQQLMRERMLFIRR